MTPNTPASRRGRPLAPSFNDSDCRPAPRMIAALPRSSQAPGTTDDHRQFHREAVRGLEALSDSANSQEALAAVFFREARHGESNPSLSVTPRTRGVATEDGILHPDDPDGPDASQQLHQFQLHRAHFEPAYTMGKQTREHHRDHNGDNGTGNGHPVHRLGIELIFSLQGVSTICVLFRLYIRLIVIRKPGLDDLFVVLFIVGASRGFPSQGAIPCPNQVLIKRQITIGISAVCVSLCWSFHEP